MVYINSDGSIGVKPWHKNIRGIFWGCLNFVTALNSLASCNDHYLLSLTLQPPFIPVVFGFQTLINPGWRNNGNQYLNNQRWDGGTGGGGSGGSGPSWRPGGPRGQCRTISSLQSPMPFGG